MVEMDTPDGKRLSVAMMPRWLAVLLAGTAISILVGAGATLIDHDTRLAVAESEIGGMTFEIRGMRQDIRDLTRELR